jgi:succinate dehydrogenase / fumarate reductase flavoprotein subunit
MREPSDSDLEAANQRLARLERRRYRKASPTCARNSRTSCRTTSACSARAIHARGDRALEALRPRIEAVGLADKTRAFNTARIEALELQNLFEVARCHRRVSGGSARRVAARMRAMTSRSVTTTTGCATRCSSRKKRVGKRAVNFAPRTMDAFAPKIRTY